jgi:cellulose synthase operon protein B
MHRTLLSLALLASSSGVAFPQATPFDMTPEKPAEVVAPQPPAPSPVLPPSEPTPEPMEDGLAPAPSAGGVALPNGSAAASEHRDRNRRYLLPFGNLSLSGEIDARRWVTYLTQKEAAAATTVTIGYQSSILVSPESSKLTLEVNGVTSGSAAIASPDDANGRMVFTLPHGVLKPGANLLSLSARQTHRTDCTPQSTYDLWTRLDPANTYLSFSGDVAGELTSVGDIAAVGLDADRVTTIDIVAPAMDNPTRTDELLRLSQALALRAHMPNEKITIRPDLPSSYHTGSLVVLFGTTAEIAGMLPYAPQDARTGASVSFIPGPPSFDGANALVVSGPTPESLQFAIDTLAGSRATSATESAATINTDWSSSDAQVIDSETTLPLSQLGVRSQEFSGRRFHTSFTFAVPSDFYAQAYGEAQILLDAAYSPEVLPGSQVDIYVNGHIASTMPISSKEGGIFRHMPIKIPMRHFVPGTNEIAIEAVLHTEADATCLPGAAKSHTPRFALFDTSAFYMPDFARLGVTPNLAATNGTAAPYSAATAQRPAALYMNRLDTATLSATATLAARLANSAGHIIPLDVVSTPAAITGRDSIVVGAISEMSPALLSHLNIEANSQTGWHTPNVATRGDGNEVKFDDWKTKVRDGGWQGNIGVFGDWFARNFNLTSDSLRFLPSDDVDFAPSDTSSFMIAQGKIGAEKGIVTLVTAPTGNDLDLGMTSMAKEENWHRISGRISTLNTANNEIETVVPEHTELFATQPFSFSNWRLIAANWFSSNISLYAFVLAGFLVALGLVTNFLLGRLGRRH